MLLSSGNWSESVRQVLLPRSDVMVLRGEHTEHTEFRAFKSLDDSEQYTSYNCTTCFRRLYTVRRSAAFETVIWMQTDCNVWVIFQLSGSFFDQWQVAFSGSCFASAGLVTVNTWQRRLTALPKFVDRFRRKFFCRIRWSDHIGSNDRMTRRWVGLLHWTSFDSI